MTEVLMNGCCSHFLPPFFFFFFNFSPSFVNSSPPNLRKILRFGQFLGVTVFFIFHLFSNSQHFEGIIRKIISQLFLSQWPVS